MPVAREGLLAFLAQINEHDEAAMSAGYEYPARRSGRTTESWPLANPGSWAPADGVGPLGARRCLEGVERVSIACGRHDPGRRGAGAFAAGKSQPLLSAAGDRAWSMCS